MSRASDLIKKLNNISEGYIAVNFDKSTQQIIWDDVMEPILNKASWGSLGTRDDSHEELDMDKKHITLMYSPDTPALEITPELNGSELVLNNPRFSLFGEDGDYLVLEFDNEKLQDLHQVYKEAGEVNTFNEYRPHITLFKGVSEVDFETLPKLPRQITVKVNQHYSEEIK